MNDDLAQALLAEMRTLNRNIESLTLEITEAASMISASHLVAVDATRSDVYATLMDDQLIDAARKLKLLMKVAR